jgi:prefoldin subunit 5
MDTSLLIDAKIKQLKDLKVRLEIEITTLNKEEDQVKNDAFGVMNHLKNLAASQIGRGTGLESMLGETYNRAKNKQFSSAQEYIDHLNQSIAEIRDYISHINQAIANLEKSHHDLDYLMNSVNTWIAKADDLLK